MEISHLGHSSFKLRWKNVILVTDPFDPKLVGKNFEVKRADIVTISHGHKDHNYLEGVKDSSLAIVGPGEYEAKGVKVRGIACFHDKSQGAKRGKNTVYHISMGGFSIVHCGDLGHKFSEDQAEALDGVDVLFIPIGGKYTIDSKEAVEIIAQLEPRIIIPMHYKSKDISKENFGELEEIDVFLKEIDQPNVKPQDKLVVKQDSLPEESTVVILK